MKQPLWISVGIGLVVLAEGADARVLEEIIDTRDHVLSEQIPSVSRGIKLLALQADNGRESVGLSFREESAMTFGLGALSEEEQRVLANVYGLERKITFLSDRVIVHPSALIEEQIRERFTGGGGGFYLRLGSRKKI
jgi:hypothetical protein